MNEVPIYRQVLGDTFDRMDDIVRRFHSVSGHKVYSGTVTIDGAESIPGRVIAALARLPGTTAASPFTFSLRADGRSETWQRNFPGHEMRSVLVAESGRLVERLGIFRLRFSLQADRDGLSMTLERIAAFGIPCPRWLFPRVIARETSEGSDFFFYIELHVPLAGRVVRYRGSLDMNSVRDAC